MDYVFIFLEVGSDCHVWVMVRVVALPGIFVILYSFDYLHQVALISQMKGYGFL